MKRIDVLFKKNRLLIFEFFLNLIYAIEWRREKKKIKHKTIVSKLPQKVKRNEKFKKSNRSNYNPICISTQIFLYYIKKNFLIKKITPEIINKKNCN